MVLRASGEPLLPTTRRQNRRAACIHEENSLDTASSDRTGAPAYEGDPIMIKYSEVKSDLLKNPRVRRAYSELQPQFDLARQFH
jgi:hypothetical protein